MLRGISAVEDALTQLSQQAAPGIGHNRPPGSEDARLLDPSELEQIKREATLFKNMSPATTPPSEASATASRWRVFGEWVLAYIMKQGDNLITEAVKALGKQLPLWAILGDRLIAASDAILTWLRSLPSP
jgi:hypothetical protein